MSGGEENAKRWRITIQEMLFAMTGIGLALTTVRFPTLWLLGLFAFGATVGSLLGRLHRGSVLFRDAYLGGLTMVGFYFLIAIALVTAMIIKSMLD